VNKLDEINSARVAGLEPLQREDVERRGIATDRGDEADFGEWAQRDLTAARLRLVWENRRFLGRLTFGAMVLFSIIVLLIPNRYESVARLMPPDNDSGSGLALAAAALSMGPSGLGGMAGDLLGQKSTSDLVAGVLRSRTVEDRIIEKYDLRKTFGNKPIEELRKALENRTDIMIDRKSQIITLSVADGKPQRAAAMAQTYIEELNRTLSAVSSSAARRERIFLEGRLQTVSQDLEASEKEFSQFSSKNGAIDLKEQGKAMVTAAATLEGELIAARSELEGLRQIYTDNNVRVRSLQARISELQNQLAKVGGDSDTDSTEPEPESSSLYPTMRQLPLLGVPYADLYRKTRVQETVFETLTQKYELAKVQEAKELPTIKVLDPPSIPEKKSFPPRTLIVLLGGLMAFCGGLMWVFGRSRWEQSDPTNPGKILAVEVFDTVKGAIPWASRNGHGTPDGKSAVARAKSSESGRR
jgi:uncharacterized protein involved in exopolysaccharide biosynthesis